jgi:hypothetical protein
VATGFVNRLVLFDSGDKPPDANIEREDIFPSAVRKTALELKKHEPVRSDTVPIRYDGPSYAAFRDFDNYARERAALGDEHEIWGRANQNALILSGIIAVGVNPRRPVIVREVAEWSTRLITWSINCWLTRIGQTVSSGRREKQSKKVEQLIRRAKSLSHRAGKKERDVMEMKSGRMPRAVLMRLTRELNKRELDDILDQLVEGALIGESDDNDYVTYWPKI